MANFAHIFVEGDADVKFIPDYIAHIKSDTQINLNKRKKPNEANVCLNGAMIATVHGLSGWTDIANMRTIITQYKDSGNTVLVIFGADTDENDGGFVKRRKQIGNYTLPLDGLSLFPMACLSSQTNRTPRLMAKWVLAEHIYRRRRRERRRWVSGKDCNGSPAREGTGKRGRAGKG
ncbi:MAG: hypothetical protein Pg6C_17750 [Treponemataceae bacterium]|nr:MAG: hypothetical protein Pg6C_17750 [Treponemataceae bacterium]